MHSFLAMSRNSCPVTENPPIKTTITTAGLLYLTRSLPNIKRNCYYPLDRQLRCESITSQFQTLHTVSVKNSYNTVSPSPCSTAPGGPGPPHCQGFRITLRHTTLGWTPLDERSARSRDLYVAKKKQRSQEKDIHAPGGIRTRNLSTRAAADPRAATRIGVPRYTFQYNPQILGFPSRLFPSDLPTKTPYAFTFRSNLHIWPSVTCSF